MPEGLLLAVWSLIGLWVVVGLGWVEEIGPTANSVLYLTDYSGLSYTVCTRPRPAKINSSGIHMHIAQSSRRISAVWHAYRAHHSSCIDR